jgi:hypothetical protein
MVKEYCRSGIFCSRLSTAEIRFHFIYFLGKRKTVGSESLVGNRVCR